MTGIENGGSGCGACRASEIETGRDAHGLALSPDGRLAYVANRADKNLAIVDTASLMVREKLPLGKRPYLCATSRDGNYLYITHHEDNSLSVVDLPARKVIFNAPVGKGPHGVAVNWAMADMPSEWER